MSAMIALLMKYKYALPDNRKNVSHDGAVHEMRLRTHWESKWQERVTHDYAAHEI